MISRRFHRVNVEITNRCNGGCAFCPGGSAQGASERRPPRAMSVTEFEHIVRQLVPMTGEIVPHLLGEPLMHPDFGDILDVALNAGVPMNIVTNGTHWAENHIQWLLHPGVRQISVSLQARPDGDFLPQIMSFCERAERERPDLYVNLRLWAMERADAGLPTVSQEVREALAKQWNIDYSSISVDVRRQKHVALRGRHYLHFDTAFEWPNINSDERHSRGFCHGLSGHFGILSDGTVVPCCLDHAGSMPLGNVFKTPVAEVLESARARCIHDGFARRQLVEPLCRRCGFIERFGR